MAEPVIASYSPVEVEVKEGESYWWCTCGRSGNQPWCDGSHAGTDFTPQEYVPPRTRTLFLCACKHTKKGPFCDNTHNNLKR